MSLSPQTSTRGKWCDFKVLKLILSDYLDQYDHAMCMNTDDPAYAEFKDRYGDRVIGYQSEDPTTEILARDIFHHLRTSLDDYRAGEQTAFPLRDAVRVVSVKVWETSHSWAEFTG